ncbi:DEAD-box ATP-dependent RNA helicase 35 [Camellia lanceoleosa]|uniref:DEAD-box ATP-dependent RNA helicase 35 n=1 Tax=Camellia lanceoleosa TaxID=1840588 RepID=A0ACC0G9F7_9ERIC|nr:DEAD-box ATP-dependent RNA helicase 35 [Camellia lanceoleosa]
MLAKDPSSGFDILQEEREYAISSFKTGKKDVLVATVVASKGLDFPDIQHVINYDMPAEIENYVHRIGQTGRCGKTGIVTTFINKNQILAELNDPMEDVDTITNASEVKGCAYCGGLGHRIHDCPKLEHQKSQAIASSRRDYFGSGEEVASLKGQIQAHEGRFVEFEHFMREMRGNHSGYSSSDEQVGVSLKVASPRLRVWSDGEVLWVECDLCLLSVCCNLLLLACADLSAICVCYLSIAICEETSLDLLCTSLGLIDAWLPLLETPAGIVFLLPWFVELWKHCNRLNVAGSA